MFFKKKSNALTFQLEEAIKLVKHASFLASPYLYEKDYQPTEAEIDLFQTLHNACQQANAYIGYTLHQFQQRRDPTQKPKHSVLDAYTSP